MMKTIDSSGYEPNYADNVVAAPATAAKKIIVLVIVALFE
jgi:hypothetical protein